MAIPTLGASEWYIEVLKINFSCRLNILQISSFRCRCGDIWRRNREANSVFGRRKPHQNRSVNGDAMSYWTTN